jgi:hypothetical protein
MMSGKPAGYSFVQPQTMRLSCDGYAVSVRMPALR